MVLGGLCRSRGLKRKKERIEKKDGGDVEAIPNWPFGLVLNSQSRATVAEDEADAIDWDSERLKDPRDKEWLREVNAALVSAWKPELRKLQR